jgi:hypothetical protein
MPIRDELLERYNALTDEELSAHLSRPAAEFTAAELEAALSVREARRQIREATAEESDALVTEDDRADRGSTPLRVLGAALLLLPWLTVITRGGSFSDRAFAAWLLAAVSALIGANVARRWNLKRNRSPTWEATVPGAFGGLAVAVGVCFLAGIDRLFLAGALGAGVLVGAGAGVFVSGLRRR